MEYVRHPLIREGAVLRREYQLNIAGTALRGNTLVVLPTGLGKTVIAALVMAEVLRIGGRVLMLAPTRPLVMQHVKTLRSILRAEPICELTGRTPRTERPRIWRGCPVVVATPQTVLSMMKEGHRPSEFSLLVVDEAHRAVGDYAYVPIAREFLEDGRGRILALTASPPSTREGLREVLRNLGIRFIEARTPQDPDVRPYVAGMEIKVVKVAMPERWRALRKTLKEILKDFLSKLEELGLVDRGATRGDLARLIEDLKGRLDSELSRRGSLFGAIQLATAALKVDYALEFLETQGAEACYDYLRRISRERRSRADSIVVNHPLFQVALIQAREAVREPNPKLEKLRSLVAEALEGGGRVIVFTKYRKSVQVIVDALSEVPGAVPVRFVGQASRGDRGMSQREQAEVLEAFRLGHYNVLVATSVAEEGLDVPEVDTVIFYEPVESAIRSIQRRGRTGRRRFGRVIVLVMEGSRDINYYWAGRWRERRIMSLIRAIRESHPDKVPKRRWNPFSGTGTVQSRIDDF
ncbi:MAG: DEAD/DEAH box helicase [Thermoplasmata archaeon]|nr:DEAD/DEAH box helicase [Thermoplasmata archaeon]